MSTVRTALVQARWTGDAESMIVEHEERTRRAAAQGARIACFQELFSTPYFCQVEDPAFRGLAERVPGPTTERFAALARELGIVLVLPLYEEDRRGDRYNTAAVVDADGTYLGKYRKAHIPQVPGFHERFYFRPGDLGFPVFDTAAGRIGVCICYDKNFPETWRALRLAGAQTVFNPAALAGPVSTRLWRLVQPAAAASNQFFVAAVNRVGVEELGGSRFYGSSYVVDPRGRFVGDLAGSDESQLVVRDLSLDLLADVRSRTDLDGDRRPDTYGDLTRPVTAS